MIFPIALILEKNIGIKIVLSSLLLLITINANINSNDPITLTDTPLTVESIDYYSKNVGYNGYMMVDYNLEYINGLNNNDKRISDFFNSDAEVLLGNCIELKTGEKVETIYNYSSYFDTFPKAYTTKRCENYWDIPFFKDTLDGLSVYIDDRYTDQIIELLEP